MLIHLPQMLLKIKLKVMECEIMDRIKVVILYTLLLCGVFAMPIAEGSTDPCFLSSNKNLNQCQQYRYDTINVYFRDEFYVEHKAITKRVISRASGALVHANYDFEVQCHNQLDCTNLEIMTEAALWAFRNAIVENRLYEIIYEPCDPSRELCCDELTCQQVLGVGDKSNTTSASISSGKKNDRRVDQAIQNTAAVTTTLDILSRNARTMNEYKNDTAQQAFPIKPLFVLRKINTGSFKVCRLGVAENGYAFCAELDGRIMDYGGSGYAEFTHGDGRYLNNELENFLWQYFVIDRGMTCSQTMSCSNNNNCIIAVSCQVR